MSSSLPPPSVSVVDAATINQRSATNPEASAWVSASAGSGKTRVLSQRVLTLLLEGTLPSRILCLTFTKAAAAEMDNRIVRSLSEWVTSSEDELLKDLQEILGSRLKPIHFKRARQLFAQVLDSPGGLQISTLHAFCQSLLRRFPLEADIAPHFTLIDERDANETLARALEATLADAPQDDSLRNAMKVITARVHEINFADLMDEMVSARAKLTRMLAAYGGQIDVASEAIAACLDVTVTMTDEQVVAAACEENAFHRTDLERAVSAMERGSKNDQDRASIIRAWLTTEDRAAAFEKYLRAFLTVKGEPRAPNTLVTQTTSKAFPDVRAVIESEYDRIIAVRRKRCSVEVCVASCALLRVGTEVLARYKREKSLRNWIDYDDLIQTARRLLERPDFSAWVLYKLDGGIDHVLVDEAQDTNPDQWAILTALTDEFFAGEGARAQTRTVFAVGDRKQSIYSFQGADPDSFDRMQARFAAHVGAADAKWESVELNVSFRSVPAVLDAVDAVFATPAARAGVVIGGTTLKHLAARQNDAGLVEIWPPIAPAAEDEPQPWKPPVERVAGDVPAFRLAALIAKKIAHMVNSGERLIAKDRPIRPGDIMILVRRRTGFVEELVRRLKQANIAVAGVDRMVLTEQLAVMDLMALGRFLLLPADDLTLATVLKGPLMGLTEEELFILAHGRDDQRLWDVLKVHAGSTSRFGEAHAWLEDLLKRTDYATPAELYAHVLVAQHGRRKILSRLGEEADDPIDEFLRLALAYQETHPPSLEGFLHWLERGQTEIKRDLDQTGADAVRVITVHGAKGLQAPIVFLPDTTQTPLGRQRLYWTDDDAGLLLWPPRSADMEDVCTALKDSADAARDEEYRRLLYVAMTRAEDRLYVCGWHTRRPAAPEKTWYGMIAAGLQDLAQPITDEFLAREGSLPGGTVLRLESAQRVPPKTPDAPPVTPAVEPLQPWATTPARAEETPPRPLAPSQGPLPDPPATSPLAEGALRFQRGLIIHRLLQSLPDLPPATRAAAATAFAKRPAWGLGADQQQAVVAETLAVLEAPAFAALFGPGSRAEVPITGLVGGHAIAGQVDRLAVTETDVFIVDYKTNRPPPRAAAQVDPAYVFQMAAYRAALSRIYPGRTIHCLLLWTDGAFTLELSPEQLDLALAPIT